MAAPLNPAFTAYLRQRRAFQHGPNIAQRNGGLIPSPIDFSYLRNATELKATSYPSSYDLRTLGMLSPVEDQGDYGTCWAFAAMGSLESCLLPGNPEVFSEDNLLLNSGFDLNPYIDGGNALMASAYLARWAGPVPASQDAYGDGHTPPGLTTAQHVQNVLYLPPCNSSLDNDWVKWALTNYGAVYSGIFASDTLGDTGNSTTWNAGHDSYYYDGSQVANHAIDIVGWDDNYSRYNFSTVPPGNGAFIVRNSWGKAFGSGGYFYVSYYDAQIGFNPDYPPAEGEDTNAVFCGAEQPTNYDHIYQYDSLGWTDSSGYSSDEGWFLNDFTAISGGPLAAVSFYAAEPGSTYTVYTSSGTSTTLVADGSGSFTMAGYHTVALASPVQLTAGQDFKVAVDLTTPGYTYPIPEDTNIAGYSSKATPSGRSYTSADGRSWDPDTDGNVCLKAFTRAGATDSTPPGTTVSGADAAWHRTPVSLTFSAADAGSGVASTTYSLDHGAWQTGTTTVIGAPSDHSNDGIHTVLYRSTDNAGNTETAHSCTVRIDTLGSTCGAKNATVKRGGSCRLYFKVYDRLSPKVTNVVTITTHSGVVKKRWAWGYGKNLDGWWWTSYRCRLTRGTYRILVTGRDLAGNPQRVVGKAYLYVR